MLPDLTLAYRLALLGAGGISSIALYDAMTRGLTGRDSAFADTYGLTWTLVLGNVVHGLAYAAFAGLLVAAGRHIDRVGRAARHVRRVLVGVFAVMAVMFLVAFPFLVGREGGVYTIIGSLGGIMFLAMFVSVTALGLLTVRRSELRPGAVLLASVPVVLGLTFALAAVAPGFAHPAYAETILGFGVALLGLRLQPQRGPVAQPVRS